MQKYFDAKNVCFKLSIPLLAIRPVANYISCLNLFYFEKLKYKM